MNWNWFGSNPAIGVATLTLAGLCTALIGGIFIGRLIRARRQLTADRVFESVQFDVYALLDDAADASARSALLALGPQMWRRIEFRMLKLIESLRGEGVTGFVAALGPRQLVEHTRADLSSRLVRRRLRGVHRAGALRLIECVADVERAVLDRDPDVSAAAVRALGLLGQPASATAVFGAVGAGREGLAVSALVTLCTTDARALAPQLAADSADVRRVAATVVGEAQAQSLGASVAALAVGDPSAAVRRAAVIALGTLANPQHLAAVAAATNDPEPSVRRAALIAIGRIGDHAGLPYLIAAQMWPGDLPEVAAEAALLAGRDWVRDLAAATPAQTRGPVAAAMATAELRTAR
ncbi:MAG TPA: HEAT repeat domain-containing protein [Candidatus Lumbricidophila sp.]|nr:HEAT repeat domain-containing protein [Candidatus Lumbricidophila sp.]